MISGNRFLLTSGLMIGLMSGLTHFKPECLVALGLDFWKLPTLFADYQADQEKSHQLDWEDRLVVQRILIKHQLTEDLLAGKVTFLHAAGWFKELHKSAEAKKAIYLSKPDDSGDEQYCRQVLDWTEAHIARNPTSCNKAFLDRLRGELAAWLVQPQALQAIGVRPEPVSAP